MELLTYDFMQRALWVGFLSGLLCPLLGVFITLRRLSLISETLAHVSLAGLAMGMTLGINPSLGAGFLSLLAAVLIEYLRRAYQHYAELALGVILAAGLALAAVLFSILQSPSTVYMGFMFGSIITITKGEAVAFTVTTFFLLLLLLRWYRPLFFITFDEEGARAAGLRVELFSVAFSCLTALVIVMSQRVIGSLLVVALIVLPAAASLRLAKSFRRALWWAVRIGEFSVLSGLIISFYFNLVPGGAIVLMAVFLFVAITIGAKLLAGKDSAERELRRGYS